MPKFKSLIIGKASISKARQIHRVGSKALKYIHLALRKSKTSTSSKPPNSSYVPDVISYSNSHSGPTAFTASLRRLRVRKSAFLTIKSLTVFHKFIKLLGDQIDGLDGGRNNFKFNDFSDKSSNLTLELSQWVRWYGQYLDHLSWISKLLGSYPSLDNAKDQAKEQDCVSSYQTGYVMRQTDSLVIFLEHICTRPETPPLYQNKSVDEIRELVIPDYFTVVRLVMVRLQVLSERLIKPGFEPVGDFSSSDLSLVLVRLEECKTSLSGFFWCRRRLAEDFWCLVDNLKAETIKDNAELVELAGSVQVFKDVTEMVGLPGSVEKEWVTFDDSEMETEEEVKWDSHWVTFDDSEMATNEVRK